MLNVDYGIESVHLTFQDGTMLLDWHIFDV